LKLVIKSLLILTITLLSNSVFAKQEKLSGAELYQYYCHECHDNAGNSLTKTAPIIAGFSAILLFDTLAQFKQGDRKSTQVKTLDNNHTSMADISQELTEEETESISLYLSKQSFKPAIQHSDSLHVTQGKQLHEDLCNDCHGDYGKSALDDAPILAGQWKDYLSKQFEQLSNHERYMPRRMERKFRKLSEQDKISLIAFYTKNPQQ